MQFGIWTVTDNGILNIKDPFQKIFIAREAFLRTKTFEGEEVYEVLLNVMNHKKVSVKSLNVFNYTFLYAAGKFGLKLDLDLFEASVRVQSAVHALRRIQQLSD
jgi:hypothetical protein